MPSIKIMQLMTSPGGHPYGGEVTCWQSAKFTGTGIPQWIDNGLAKVPTFTRVLLQGLPSPYTDGEIIEGIHDAGHLYVQAPVGWVYIIEAYG